MRVSPRGISIGHPARKTCAKGSLFEQVEEEKPSENWLIRINPQNGRETQVVVGGSRIAV